MTILISILLYLHVLVAPGTYTTSFINDQITVNQPQVDLIESDPVEMLQVQQLYGDQANSVVVIDDTLPD